MATLSPFSGCTRMKISPFTIVSPLKPSASSGLVKVQEVFYVIADDENSLYSFDGIHHEVALLPGALPEDKKARKHEKPDFESLLIWDEDIMAFPSLSQPNRVKAVKVNPTTKCLTVLDLTGLRNSLLPDIPELNIEGSALSGDTLFLLQRGNGEQGLNALIKVDKKTLQVLSVTPVDLGTLRGNTIGFTDAFIENDLIYFVAVAETAKSTYDDGAFTGAILGKMDFSGKLLSAIDLSIAHKPEGLWLDKDTIYLVTDADDRSIPSNLYAAPRPVDF